MARPYRKVERITVHNDMQLWAVLDLSGMSAQFPQGSFVTDQLRDIGSVYAQRCSVFRDIEGVYTIFYTPGELVMRSTQKSVLMARITKDKRSRILALAVFNRSDQAIPFTRQLREAHAAGDEVKLTPYIMATGVPAAEWIGAELRVSIVELPYSPVLEAPGASPFDDVSSLTA